MNPFKTGPGAAPGTEENRFFTMKPQAWCLAWLSGFSAIGPMSVHREWFDRIGDGKGQTNPMHQSEVERLLLDRLHAGL